MRRKSDREGRAREDETHFLHRYSKESEDEEKR
jgi:hypothetical protein